MLNLKHCGDWGRVRWVVLCEYEKYQLYWDTQDLRQYVSKYMYKQLRDLVISLWKWSQTRARQKLTEVTVFLI